MSFRSGNDEVLPFSRLRPLDAKFKTLPPQAQEARLSFVKLVKPEADYGAESLDRFRDLAEGRKLMCVFGDVARSLMAASANITHSLSALTSTTRSPRSRARCCTFV